MNCSSGPSVKLPRSQRASTAAYVGYSLGLLICILGTQISGADKPSMKYKMSFDRQASVGERFRINCSYKSTETATFAAKGGRDPWKRRLSANCQGIWKTLSMGKNGAPSKVSLAVDRCTYTLDDGPEQSLPPGRIITAEIKDGTTIFSMNVGEIPEEVNRVLNEFMRPRSEGISSADERFGSKEPRRVGEEWPVGAIATAATFRSVGSNVADKDVKGSVKLTGIRKMDGVDCFVIDSDYRVANITPKSPMADRLDIIGEFHERATVLLPMDVPKKRIGFSVVTEWKHHYTWKPDDGFATPVDQTSRVEFDEHSVPLESIQE